MVLRTLIRSAGKISLTKVGEVKPIVANEISSKLSSPATTTVMPGKISIGNNGSKLSLSPGSPPPVVMSNTPFTFGTTEVMKGPSTDAGTRIVLRQERAVTKEEASKIEPSTVSTTTSMMPWKGWFQRWMISSFGFNRWESFRRTMEFMPDDIYGLQQNPKPTQPIPISKTDPTITAMYRYPSPGSQSAVSVPIFEAHEDPYDAGYFKRDTRRRHLSSELKDPTIEKAKVMLLSDPNDPTVQEEIHQLETGPLSSPGNKGNFATGPTDFDPTGLRATMSVNWSQLNASLDSHMPDHLPTPTWMGHESQVIDYWQSKGLPVPVGDFYAPNKIPTIRRVARW
jgi:hypothetical protein